MMAREAQHETLRAQWFQQCVNQRAANLGRPRLSTAKLDLLYDLWLRTQWAPLDRAIEEILRPVEVVATQESQLHLQRISELGLEAWLIKTATHHEMTAEELRAALETKVGRWSRPDQQCPEYAYVPESRAFTWWQYEVLGRQVLTGGGLW